MEDGETISRVGESERRLYGPRGLVVCGMTPEEQRTVYALVQEGDIPEVPVVFVTDALRDRTMKEVLALEDGHGLGGTCAVHRAIIMSGFAEQELHWMMAAYRRAALPRPLWATLTPTSESWAVERLLAELAAEDEAIGH